MKTYEKQSTVVEVLTSITCDCCKKTWRSEDGGMDFMLEKQEFICISTTAGYGAIMGDMNKIELDLCQHCQLSLLGKFIRVTEDDKPTVTAAEWTAEYAMRVAKHKREHPEQYI